MSRAAWQALQLCGTLALLFEGQVAGGPPISSSDLDEDPPQVQRDILGTAFGAEQDLELSFVLATSGSAGQAFLSVHLFIGSGTEGTKDGKAAGKKGCLVHEDQTSHLSENYY